MINWYSQIRRTSRFICYLRRLIRLTCRSRSLINILLILFISLLPKRHWKKYFQMILVADSGSSKTDWLLATPQQETKQFRTSGLNPYFLTEKEISKILREQ